MWYLPDGFSPFPRILAALEVLAWFPTTADLRNNLSALPGWSSRFEVPDVVNYADYVDFPEIAVPLIRRWCGQPERLSYFPFPKGNGGYRRMCLPTIHDLVLLRAAAGYMGIATERALTQHVYSARLASGPPDWHFRGNAYVKFRRDAAKRAKKWACDLMVRTDVRSYYPSIPIEGLTSVLLKSGCRFGPTRFFLERVMWWQDHCGLKGLPVGPEACGIPGTFYLRPVDEVLTPETDGYFRYTDDIIYFTGDDAAGDSMIEVLDDVLRDLKLERGADKTEIHDHPREACEAIERRLLASLSNGLSNVGPAVMPSVHDAFAREVLPNPGRAVTLFRWFLRTFRNRSDNSAVDCVTRNWDLFNVDPRESAEYIAACGLDKPEIVDRLMTKLGRPATDTTDAMDLHILRVLGDRGWGTDEERVFGRIAEDSGRRWPVRVWAWRARASTHAYSTRLAGEAAVEERDPNVRRGILLTMKGRSGRSNKWFLREIGRRYPEHAATVAWSLAA